MKGMDLGTRLRERRIARNLRNGQVAAYLGISTAHVSDMESGKSKPSLELLARLAEYYSTSTDYLLGLTQDPAPTIRAEPPPRWAEEMTDVLRRLGPLQGERLLVMAQAFAGHIEERLRLDRARSDALAILSERLGPERAALLDELVATAVASGDGGSFLGALARGDILFGDPGESLQD